MNFFNAEFSNSMGTLRSDSSNGGHIKLIKSASTSTCCANEKSRKKGNFQNKLCNKEDLHYRKFIVEPSLHLENSIINSLKEKTINKRTQNKIYNNAKHFSDCDLNVEDLKRSLFTPENLPTRFLSSGENKKEFHSHFGLDKILVNEENNNSVLNFVSVNEKRSMDEERGSIIFVEQITTSLENSQSNNRDSSEISNDLRSKSIDDKIELCAEKLRNNTKNEKQTHFDLEEKKTIRQEICNVEKQRNDTVDNDSNENEEPTCSDLERKEKTPQEICDIEQNSNKKSNNSNQLELENLINSNSFEDSQKQKEKPFRRCSSLKIHKESNSTSAQKKIVRFADVLGLDLTDVRTFLDELPSVPKSAYDDLKNDDIISGSPPKFFDSTSLETKLLVPTFRPPVLSGNFLERVRDNNVCLETVSVLDSPVCQIIGTVRVRNIDFYKSVYVRYSLDDWKTISEIQANYVPNSCDGFSDKFAFIIYVYSIAVGQKIALAIRYHCCGSIFWDNNNNNNYVFQCFPSRPTMPSYFQCFSPNSDTCNSFY